jgi:hypothetical protein
LGIAGNGFEKCAAEEDADEMAFIFGAALMIVNQISTVCDETGGFEQMAFDFLARAGK